MEEVIEYSKVKEKSDTAYRTIGEVADIVGVPQHILRFWESKFQQISPQKNKGRRYYRPSDVEDLKQIKHLLYEQGFTIKGVKQYLSSRRKNEKFNSYQANVTEDVSSANQYRKDDLKEILDSLHVIREKILSI